MKLNNAIIFIILFFLSSCSDKEIDIKKYNEDIINGLNSISNIIGIEKYEQFYDIAKSEGDTIKIPSTEFEKGVLYVKDIIEKDNYFSFVLSSGEVSNIPSVAGVKIKYRVPNISSLRLDGYDIQVKMVLKDCNSILRINHGEPNIGGMVCSLYIDFSRGRIGLYEPYTTDSEKTTEKFIEDEQQISFIVGHEYTIVSSKINGCIVKVSVTDEVSRESWTFTPDIGCYESGITNGWGRSSYEISGNIDIHDFKIYSNQDYRSKLLILGDSNADHGGIGDYKWKNYARQIKTEMQGNAFLVVQGGASTDNFLVWLDNYALDICSPQYCLITTYNEYSFYKWNNNIREIIDILESHQIIPILATIHPGSGEMISEDKRTMNDWMRNSGYFVFDMARVISKNNDGVTTNEKLLRLPDLVHFNFEANDLLAKDFFETFPFMKEN